jgi:hypothetical protein
MSTMPSFFALIRQPSAIRNACSATCRGLMSR